MDPRTERMIRADIGLRWSPVLIALFVFFGSIVGLGLIGCLGFLARFLHTVSH